MDVTTSFKIQQNVTSYQGKRRAIIIGVSDYDDKNLQELECCRNDAARISETLGKLGYEIADNHKLIGYVKYDIMREAVYDFFDNKKSGAEDTLLFYYSGHGIPTSSGSTVLASSQIDHDDPRRRGFSSSELTELIQNSIAIRIVEILDCCYSGSAKVGKGFEDLGKGTEDAAATLGTAAIENNARMLREQGEGKCLLAASQAAQEAYGLKEKGHSIFTYYLLEGLNQNRKSIDSNGVVTPYTLGNYVYRSIMNLPQNKRPKQKPIIKAEAAGDIILAYYPELVNMVDQHSMEESWINIGLQYNENEDYTNAIDSFNKVLEINPKNQRAYNYKGDAFFRMGRYDEAITCYDKALEINPRYLDVLKDKGLALERLGRNNEAMECYNEALRIRPDYHDAEYAKKMLLLKLSSPNPDPPTPRDVILGSDPKNPYNDPTLPHYNPALDKEDDSSGYPFSHDADQWSNKGSSLADLGRYEEAIKCYDKAIELRPNDTAVWYSKGNALLILNRYVQAITCYNKVLELNPNHLHTWNNKGNALYYLGRYEAAIQCYDKVLQLNPTYSDAWYSKGNALRKLGRNKDAKKCFNKARGKA